jgi:hypothetical protein
VGAPARHDDDGELQLQRAIVIKATTVSCRRLLELAMLVAARKTPGSQVEDAGRPRREQRFLALAERLAERASGATQLLDLGARL